MSTRGMSRAIASIGALGAGGMLVLAGYFALAKDTAAADALCGLGFALVGAGITPTLLAVIGRIARVGIAATLMRYLFWALVQRGEPSVDSLPIAVGCNIGGVITPGDRDDIDLWELVSLRACCSFLANAGQGLPPLILYTGRSQGYVELLAQALGLTEHKTLAALFVIENGCALYDPIKRHVTVLVGAESGEHMAEARLLLAARLPDYEFQPKTYMTTITKHAGEETNLATQVEEWLKSAGLLGKGKLAVTSSHSAVDVFPDGFDKRYGVVQALKALVEANRCTLSEEQAALLRNPTHSEAPWEAIYASSVAIAAASESNERLVRGAARAYRMAGDESLRRLTDRDHVLNSTGMEFLFEVLQKECGITVGRRRRVLRSR